MSLITGLLSGAQAPPKQDATSTIQTLCLRLSSSTLLEDRRAAILGLRSFAREFQELVASEGLRGLIACLARDREDGDTVRAVLETLLMLFVPDALNLESSGDIALWLTDEFTQKQENITILLDLLEDGDFFIRLYALQLLAAISNNRPARTQECVYTAPLGVNRLVEILGDKREAIRNEAVLLIIHLSAGHTDIQKMITFSNAFDQVFAIIDTEGGMEGGIVVQDCLQLLSNLLSFNVSNQKYFRETGGIPKLAALLDLGPEDKVLPFAREQRDTNIQYALRLVRLFVVPGGLGTVQNQNALVAAGIMHLVVKAAFSPADLAVRTEALKAVADLIDGNKPLQEAFGTMVVAPPELQPPPPLPSPDGGNKNGDRAEIEPVECGVIEGLLDLALMNSSKHVFDARFAAGRSLEAYFNGNELVRRHFLAYAIELHDHGDPSANALTCLLHLDNASRGDPYRVWIASAILIHLIYDDKEAKVLATGVKEGDAEAGEEVVTAIQGISANLIMALQHQYDPRICIGYLMLLCVWLFGDSDAVDDFLSEGASVQALVGAVKENGVDLIVQGLSTLLLGILYEFSHAQSPVSRTQVHEILTQQMERDLYVNKLTKLRSHPLIRDFEVSKDEFMPGQRPRHGHGLPEVYFDPVFVEFFKDNCGQIVRAIDKDPNLETKITANGITKVSNGVNLEELESLRGQVEESQRILAAVEDEKHAIEAQHAAEMNAVHQQFQAAQDSLQKDHSSVIAGLQKQLLAAQQLSSQLQQSFQRSREALAAETRKHNEAIETQRKKFEAEKVTADERNRTIMEEMRQRNRRTVEEKETLVQSLRKQIGELQQHAKAAANEVQQVKRQQDEAGRRSQAAAEEAERKLADVQRQAEEAVARLAAEKDAQMGKLAVEKDAQLQALQRQFEETRRNAESVDEARRQAEEHSRGLQQELEQARSYTASITSEKDSELQAARAQLEERDDQLSKLQSDLEQAAKKHAEDLESQLAERDSRLSQLQSSLDRAAKEHAQDLATQHEEHTTELKKKFSIIAELEAKLASTIDAATLEKEKTAAAEAAKARDAAVKEKEALAKECDEVKAKAEEVQTELDDLFMVLGDLEEKRKADKKRLKELGQEVSEDEDEDDDDDDNDEE
ncbi:p115 like vesicle tethering protein [Tricharina praecox]|uniref:p115 like vesicle tethering protein n=1 Tax=Tricharina praecox TaxID=43433 RepID=UPI00221FFAAD|nr:p115 like vesicle tethering protein [Tricharina praecox]KAI5853506.1 p115 like vesicle tethering protein [Tricharina praecox]